VSIIDIQYQDRAIDLFQQALYAHRLTHAHIFLGPSGVGKAFAARELTKMLFCEHPLEIPPPVDGTNHPWLDSCGTCPSCRVVQAQNHPDLHLIYKELITTFPGKEGHKASELSIDVIRREIIEKVGMKPLLGRNKVFLILEAELMSRSAQNALLKTLEEPPPNTYLFLISEQLGALLPTIRSRAQVLVFQALPEKFILDRLAQLGAGENEAKFLAQFVPGKLGSAMELFHLGVYDLNERVGKDLAAVEAAGTDDFVQWVLDEAKALAEKMMKPGPETLARAKTSEAEAGRQALKLILALVGGFCRDSLRYKLGFQETLLLNGTQMKTVHALAGKFDVEQLQTKLSALGEAEKWIDANVNVTLVVTNTINKIISG
jgi:DNA polymerase III subunit delta'